MDELKEITRKEIGLSKGITGDGYTTFPELVFDEDIDPVCNCEFVEHSRNLDQQIRAERRTVGR